MAVGCEVCSASMAKEDDEEEMTSLRQKLQDVVVSQNLDQENSRTDEMSKETPKIDDRLVLPEAIRELSEEFSNKKCVICFFGSHKSHSYLKAKEAIFLCEDCKYRIACFYTLHVQKWHELLSPRSERKLCLFAEKKERAPSREARASSCRTGGRRRRRRKRREKSGRNSCQQVLMQRYENGDPTVGPLGQPSGKFDYLVRYYKVEPERNSFNGSCEDLCSPTGWNVSE